MTAEHHGSPCWYELGTTDLAAAGAFYSAVLGWSVVDAGMEGFTYHLAMAGDQAMVAGMMALEQQDGAPPPNWVVYFACTDCDATVDAIRDGGGGVLTAPADIPGTGRFAIVSDPQGAVFGVLQPEPMDDGSSGRAFDPRAEGHGNWHELMSSDPVAAFAFYSTIFGWTKGETMDMGEMGTYQLFQHGGTDIGGIMALMGSPVSAWLPYFGSDGIDAVVGRIVAGGGTIHNGPMEVPGGAFVAGATDPQGAWFAVVGRGPTS